MADAPTNYEALRQIYRELEDERRASSDHDLLVRLGTRVEIVIGMQEAAHKRMDDMERRLRHVEGRRLLSKGVWAAAIGGGIEAIRGSLAGGWWKHLGR